MVHPLDEHPVHQVAQSMLGATLRFRGGFSVDVETLTAVSLGRHDPSGFADWASVSPADGASA